MKNNSPAGKLVINDSPAFTEARLELNSHHEVVSNFHLPPSQRQMKKIMLCVLGVSSEADGENKQSTSKLYQIGTCIYIIRSQIKMD